ncbi:PLC-like phosphodiesterase [Punctularia strigosozonata HHB-11173 SS5]|uniref:PLC-like phosphodiesterase n=1 Tax=Punctularia strigosozonata (strain HHB-11173) TaxID=741275 RepID=UPI0004418559|nr:PLC-like phosphodiesterase [Punctularia strigosozonata HHB-11173 SS5]EIN14014.1 PLC-like phosphodiesterase [Punctularia strigosozonata HHB-11173 SS5]
MHSALSILAQVALSSLAFGPSLAHAVSIVQRASTCNGHSELCDRSFGNVTFVGAHDSYAVGTNNLAVNQDYDVTQQLDDGIRMLQMQAHNDSGIIQLCHTSCLLYNGGTLQDYLGKVKTWMDTNTNDVVSLLIVNSDGFSPSDFAAVFEAAGLSNISYSPSSSAIAASDWPTLGNMIDSGTRLVTFLDHGADFNSVTYLIDEFTNIWETAFDVTDTTFDCNVNRSSGDTSTEMYLINHFLDKEVLGSPAPDVDNANTTNGVSGTGSLGEQALDTCVATNGRYPNFMLVDFYEYGGGSVFQVAATANGVTYEPSTPIATPKSQTSSTSSSGSSSSGGVPTSTIPWKLGGLSAFTILGGMLFSAWTIL